MIIVTAIKGLPQNTMPWCLWCSGLEQEELPCCSLSNLGNFLQKLYWLWALCFLSCFGSFLYLARSQREAAALCLISQDGFINGFLGNGPNWGIWTALPGAQLYTHSYLTALSPRVRGSCWLCHLQMVLKSVCFKCWGTSRHALESLEVGGALVFVSYLCPGV